MQRRHDERQTGSQRARERAIHQRFVNTACLILALLGLLLFLLLAFLKANEQTANSTTDHLTLTL